MSNEVTTSNRQGTVVSGATLVKGNTVIEKQVRDTYTKALINQDNAAGRVSSLTPAYGQMLFKAIGIDVAIALGKTSQETRKAFYSKPTAKVLSAERDAFKASYKSFIKLPKKPIKGSKKVDAFMEILDKWEAECEKIMSAASTRADTYWNRVIGHCVAFGEAEKDLVKIKAAKEKKVSQLATQLASENDSKKSDAILKDLNVVKKDLQLIEDNPRKAAKKFKSAAPLSPAAFRREIREGIEKLVSRIREQENADKKSVDAVKSLNTVIDSLK